MAIQVLFYSTCRAHMNLTWNGIVRQPIPHSPFPIPHYSFLFPRGAYFEVYIYSRTAPPPPPLFLYVSLFFPFLSSFFKTFFFFSFFLFFLFFPLLFFFWALFFTLFPSFFLFFLSPPLPSPPSYRSRWLKTCRPRLSLPEDLSEPSSTTPSTTSTRYY